MYRMACSHDQWPWALAYAWAQDLATLGQDIEYQEIGTMGQDTTKLPSHGPRYVDIFSCGEWPLATTNGHGHWPWAWARAQDPGALGQDIKYSRVRVG